MSYVWAILIFTLVVIIHEYGHFLLARKGGITVTEFSVGMGPRILSHVSKKSGVRYSLKLFPIGGSCAMVGEDEKSEDPNAFNNRPLHSRILTVAAGPVFNFILAFILSLFVIGIAGYDPATITYVEKGSAAEEAGLQVGDTIVKMDKNRITIGREVSTFLQFYNFTDKPASIKVKRDGRTLSFNVVPREKDTYLLGFTYMSNDVACEIAEITEGGAMDNAGIKTGDIITSINGTQISKGTELYQYFIDNPLNGSEISVTVKRGNESISVNVVPTYYGTSKTLGFSYNLYREKGGFFTTIKYSLNEVRFWISNTIHSFALMFRGQVSRDDIAGPVGIVNMIGSTYEQSKEEGFLVVFLSMANICILLSSNLGVINLFPLPALDGGRLVFLIIEGIRKKPVPAEKEGMVHLIGFILLMVLMVLVLFNDVAKLFGF